ncbi:MAM and LDL-receptor class A domain-containing protein 1-like [Mya arenaria]|uniref:MAM and LDL-receptor class A domain-containing protein 1-like n=1 Tax=Mya arenaria TaxID=6604 RepID=UPI0022E8D711|nr:MAM and LDL-receptor class A domain-containing protein 1-like [Mya arenaria]
MPRAEIKTVTESQCVFENDFCDWSRAPGSTFNFQRHKGQTDAAGKTGPRTNCKGSDGYFIYVDATGNPGELAKLRSPNFPMGHYCFEFWYHMYGEDMGTLKVWVFASGMKRKLLKKFAKNQGKKWFEFEARIGNNFASDIALDDISITPGRCL